MWYRWLVSMMAEENLVLLWYYLNFQCRRQRVFATNIDLPTLHALLDQKKMKDLEMEEDDLDYPSKLKDMQQFRKQGLEPVLSWLTKVRGVEGMPLLYVICDSVMLPKGEDPSNGYELLDAELIRQAPHTEMIFLQDNRKVWGLIHHMFVDTGAWSWV